MTYSHNILASLFLVFALTCPTSPKAGMLEAEIAFNAEDYETSFREYLPLAESGIPKAQERLARHYQYGVGTEKNLPTAVLWYKRAAEKGYIEAASRLGHIYLEQESYATALEWFLVSAERFSVKAQFFAGTIYLNKTAGMYDLEKGTYWLKQSAGKGYANAQYRLGKLLIDEGVSKNVGEAIKWLRRAADQDNTEAILLLAQLRLYGLDELNQE